MKQIAWIISPPAKGSGGFRTICSKASFLDSRGYENYFYIMPGCEAGTVKILSQIDLAVSGPVLF